MSSTGMECLTVLVFGVFAWFGMGFFGWLCKVSDKYIPDDHDCKA